MLTKDTIRFDHPKLDGLELPRFTARGTQDGPRLTILAGIHGCEYTSIAAVRAFMGALDTRRLVGTVVAVPVVNMPAFTQRTPFVVPVDGKNLNRCFPGNPGGSYTDVLAHCVYTELIIGSDYLLDLHAGDAVEALEPFVLYDESPVEDQTRELARAYGLGHVVRQPAAAQTVGGSTSAAAAAAGIPGITAEAGGRGLLERGAIDLHLGGLQNALRHLRMAPADQQEDSRPVRHHTGWAWLRSKAAGWWNPAVEVGQDVDAGGLLGSIETLHGDVLEHVTAPTAGVPLFITSSPAVAADGLLLGLAIGG